MDSVVEEISPSFTSRTLGRVCLLSAHVIAASLTMFPSGFYMPYEKLGKDVFLLASPTMIHCFVADAEAMTQITTRRTDFPKPLEMYRALDIYGKNLVSTEGADWRMHRKLAAPSFGERNNELVFTESLHHAKSLLGLWAGPDGRGNQTVAEPSLGAMNFALYVISSAGFDVRVVWPHEEGMPASERRSEGKSMFVGSEVPSGHQMNYFTTSW
jgi:cytochrome P450